MSLASAMLNVLSALTAAEKKLIPEFPVEISHTKEKSPEVFEKAGAKRAAVVMKRKDLKSEEGKLYEAKEVSLEQLQDPKRKFDLAMWADDMAQARKLAKDLEDRRTWGSGPIVVPPALAPEHDAKVEQQVKVGEPKEEFPKGKQAGDMGKKAKVNDADPSKETMNKLKASGIAARGFEQRMDEGVSEDEQLAGTEEDGEEIGDCQVRIYDNGGETVDRYTVVIDYPDGSQSWLGSSEKPFDPQGFGQHVGDEGSGNQEGEHLGKRVKFSEVPKDVQKFIEQDCKFEEEVEGSLKASEEGGPRFNLVWKGETIEEDLDEKEANYLLNEYNLAYKGGVQKVRASKEEPAKFLNHYECPCGEKWEDRSAYTNNDRCPKCNKEISPTSSEDIEASLKVSAEPVDEEIVEFQFLSLGMDAEQYFSGFTSGNNWDEAFYGIGDSEKEAAEDAIDMAVQSLSISEEVGNAMDAEIAKMSDEDEVHEEVLEFVKEENPGASEEELEMAMEEAMETTELHVYVGLRVKTAPKAGTGEGPAHEASETPAEEAAEHKAE